MLDLSYIRENKDLVREALKTRAPKLDFDGFLKMDTDRRALLKELEALRGEKNKANDEITALLREKKDPKAKIASMKSIAQKIDEFESKVGDIEIKIIDIQLIIPNIPNKSEFYFVHSFYVKPFSKEESSLTAFSPPFAIFRTNGSVAFVSAKVEVRGKAPGMLATQ